MACAQEFTPDFYDNPEEVFKFPFIVEEETIKFIQEHGRIMFIIRGPPGTKKQELCEIMVKKYPTAVVCSAIDYFQYTFLSNVRSKTRVKESHMYSEKKTQVECAKGSHPIIVKNTHMRKFEMQRYLDLASEYDYTVIMVITLNKFKVTPEILAQSNSKGLKSDFFIRRLRQWEVVPPILMGWFLSPEDSSFVLFQLQSSLKVILEESEFCESFNSLIKGDFLKHYKAKKLLCCVAAYGIHCLPEQIKSYYLSDKVKEHYGQYFTISIDAFLVTQSHIFAAVHLEEAMKSLIHVPDQTNEVDSETDCVLKFSSCYLQDITSLQSKQYSQYCKMIPFDQEFSPSVKTAVLEDWRDADNVNMSYCDYILLAQNGEKTHLPLMLKSIFEKNISEMSDSDQQIKTDLFRKLKNELRIYKSQNNKSWLLKLPSKNKIKTIFTGLYV